MKKILIFSLLILLSACSLHVGDFTENRERLHNIGQEDDYCEKNPDRCVNGIPW